MSTCLILKVLKGEVLKKETENIIFSDSLITFRKIDIVAIGRGAAADITLPCPSVSRKHCTFVKTDKGWVLKDDNSKSGTFVIRKDKFWAELYKGGEFDSLKFGDIISLGGMEGDIVQFQLCCEK